MKVVVGHDDVRPGSASFGALVQVWNRVNAAGGAVGFAGEAAPAEVEAALNHHLAACEKGRMTLVRLYADTPLLIAEAEEEPGAAVTAQVCEDELAAWVLIEWNDFFAMRHVAQLKRLMVDPRRQGQGLGRATLDAAHAVARTNGIDIVTLEYRSGQGLGPFYRACGYEEVARWPGLLRFPFGERDAVGMMTTL